VDDLYSLNVLPNPTIADLHPLVGGNGRDTLRLDGSGLSLNLMTLKDNRIKGIETIDIAGSGNI